MKKNKEIKNKLGVSEIAISDEGVGGEGESLIEEKKASA